MHRVLKPGGRVLILEFSHPTDANLKTLYDLYSFTVLPTLGQVIANDRSSYQYLAESIRKHPDQETLKEMMVTAGLSECQYTNLNGGIVAMHTGTKV
jgi:demethylmenaquinone methyltransferase/2-methoxy-6-polyprenyl-1,4-benzoquinol methylase